MKNYEIFTNLEKKIIELKRELIMKILSKWLILYLEEKVKTAFTTEKELEAAELVITWVKEFFSNENYNPE